MWSRPVSAGALSSISAFRLPAVSDPYESNLLRHSDIVNGVGRMLPHASGDHHAEGHGKNRQKRKKEPEECFGKVAAHAASILQPHFVNDWEGEVEHDALLKTTKYTSHKNRHLVMCANMRS